MKTKLAFVCVQLSIFGMTLSLFAQDITRQPRSGRRSGSNASVERW